MDEDLKLPIIEPDMVGAFEGDVWFGHPVKRSLGTHCWQGGEWVLLPSELESVLELLAVRTAQRDAAAERERELVEALRPFAEVGMRYNEPSRADMGDDWLGTAHSFKIGDFRNAARALQAKETSQTNDNLNVPTSGSLVPSSGPGVGALQAKEATL